MVVVLAAGAVGGGVRAVVVLVVLVVLAALVLVAAAAGAAVLVAGGGAGLAWAVPTGPTKGVTRSSRGKAVDVRSLLLEAAVARSFAESSTIAGCWVVGALFAATAAGAAAGALVEVGATAVAA